MAKKGKRRCDTLPILHPDAAGIDVGASELFVSVSADRDSDFVPTSCQACWFSFNAGTSTNDDPMQQIKSRR